jgi:broad specificity phosphatase PhoE
MFDHHDQQETRRQAEARAAEAARQLAELAAGGQDVLVVAHGYFNTMVGLALRRHGWRCVEDGGFTYWAARRFEVQHR